MVRATYHLPNLESEGLYDYPFLPIWTYAIMIGSQEGVLV